MTKPMLFENDVQFWFETQRALGHTTYGGADTGEVLATAARITPGDYNSWYDEWFATAQTIEAEARQSLARGHRITARDGLLRASNYFRCAEFFLHGDPTDPRIGISYERAVGAFRDALPFLPYSVEPVEIPYEGTTLSGYFYRGAGADAPTVVMHNGFDGSVEEMHFFGAAAAVERGFNVLSFDGPGQPSSRHRDGLVFRPDWENVVTPVIDWLLATHGADTDPEQIALLGISMGGILAPRAAAFEHRLAAVIAIDGVYDLGAAATEPLPMPREQAEHIIRLPEAPELDAALDELTKTNPTLRWAFTHGMYAMGVDSPRAFLASYLDYSLADCVAEQIECPVLVADAEEDLFFQGQPEELFDHITAPKALLRFTTAEGAGAHCHSGAQRLAFGRVYDWLEEALAARTSSASSSGEKNLPDSSTAWTAAVTA